MSPIQYSHTVYMLADTQVIGEGTNQLLVHVHLYLYIECAHTCIATV